MLTSQGGVEVADTEDLTKQSVRVKVWSYMTENNIARFPRPVQNRIPNFEGANECGPKITLLEVFTSSQTIKVNPDKPQEEVRFLTLQAGKRLLVPSTRLRSGLFNLLENEGNDDSQTLRRKAQSEGLKHMSKPIELQDKIKVDLIILGSVAVAITGERIGKGEGFADLEYAMMKTLKAIDDSVPVITTVHDCQVFDRLPSRLFKEHDVPVDIIVTPTQIIHVNHKLEKPSGIYWHLLSIEKFSQIPILKTFFEMEKSINPDVALLDGVIPSDEALADLEEQNKVRNEGERTFYAHRNRGRGRFYGYRGGRSAAGYSQNTDAEGRTYTREIFRGRGRGASRGRSRSRITEADGEMSNKDFQGAFHHPNNIQVTINVNKKNKIVSRQVEATRPISDSNDDHSKEDPPVKAPKSNRRKGENNFSIYIGGIPHGCWPQELKKELSDREVWPTNIAWKYPGYAFLNFKNVKDEENQTIEALQGLSLKQSMLKVSLSDKRRDETEKSVVSITSPESSEINGTQNVTPLSEARMSSGIEDSTGGTNVARTSAGIENSNEATNVVRASLGIEDSTGGTSVVRTSSGIEDSTGGTSVVRTSSEIEDSTGGTSEERTSSGIENSTGGASTNPVAALPSLGTSLAANEKNGGTSEKEVHLTNDCDKVVRENPVSQHTTEDKVSDDRKEESKNEIDANCVGELANVKNDVGGEELTKNENVDGWGGQPSVNSDTPWT